MRFIFLLYISLVSTITLAQKNGFYLLNIPKSAGVSALGGESITGVGKWNGASLENPALLSDSIGNAVHLDYFNYIAGSHLSSASAWLQVNGMPFVISFRNLNYGEFEGYDAGGDPTENFRAADYQFSLGSGLASGNYHLGLNLNFIHSSYGDWSAQGVGIDLSGAYFHPVRELVISAQIKNFGFALNDFYDGAATTKMPLDIKIGSTFKPQNMPFRFTLTLHGLNPFENSVLSGSGELSGEKEWLSYLVAGGELLLSDNFQAIMGMNFSRRYELKQITGTAGAGFNYGFRFSKPNFVFTYGNSGIHSGEKGHHFSLDFNTNVFKELYKKKK